jgi:hypothetical protein
MVRLGGLRVQVPNRHRIDSAVTDKTITMRQVVRVLGDKASGHEAFAGLGGAQPLAWLK